MQIMMRHHAVKLNREEFDKGEKVNIYGRVVSYTHHSCSNSGFTTWNALDMTKEFRAQFVY
jgi:uncharacterized protein YneR